MLIDSLASVYGFITLGTLLLRYFWIRKGKMMLTQNSKIPPHFLVIVPGWMGSKLQAKDKMVWGNFSHMLRNPLQWRAQLDFLFQAMTYPNLELKPAGILDEVVFAPPWGKLQKYNRLLLLLRDMGYSINPAHDVKDTMAAYTFAYDWRQDNRISAQQLGIFIERLRTDHHGAQAWIIAHSNGGLVARWYIEKLGGSVDYVGRLFLMGSPWDGTPKALWLLTDGLGVMFRPKFNLFNIQQRSRDLVRTFPSLYQLLPYANPFLRSLDNELVSVFSGRNWLEKERHALLEDGLRFNQDLGTALSVETLCFFGVQQPTPTAGLVSFLAGTRWGKITWIKSEAGDGTIPRGSAVHPNAKEKLPYAALHGNIYVATDVLAKLKYELVDQYLQPERSALSTPRLTITLEPDKDVYRPGEDIKVLLTIFTNDPAPLPVSGASIEVSFEWLQPLPGTEQPVPPPTIAPENIWEVDDSPGHYMETLKAPLIEGYYQLKSVVKVAGEASLSLEELIAVDAM